MLLEKDAKLLMIGDSITDFDRARPVGEGLGEGVGKSYVMLVDALLKITAPEYQVRVVSMGSSGNTSRDLCARWERDVLALTPDWVSVLIGINDVWRQFDTPLQPELHVSLREYEHNLRTLIVRTRPKVKGMLLLSPFFFEPNLADPMRKAMDAYGACMCRLAREYQLPFVDLQGEFDRYFLHWPPASMNWDRVHPDITGHLLIARAVLAALQGTGV